MFEGQEMWFYHTRNPELYIISPDKTFASADDMRMVHPNELTSVRKIGKPINSAPKPKTPDEKSHQDKVNQFFIRMAIKMPANCENCGQSFNAFSLEDKRCVTAHILAKRKEYGFPSVADNDDNCIFLGTHCGCHDYFDRCRATERAGMNCYHLVIERYNKFKHLLTGKEIVRAEKYLHINP